MEVNNLVSILVLSYNNLQYLNQCLDSILQQDYPYIEIIISDDFSGNFQKDEIERYINDNKKENIVNYIISQSACNLGLVKNINNAIKLATGNYFVNIACDDVFFDYQVISSIVQFYSVTNYLVSVGFVAMFDEQLKVCLGTTPTREYIKYLYGNPIDCYRVFCQGNFIPSPGMSYRRELINKYGMYDENYKLLEDYPRWLYLTRNGCSIGFLDRYVVKYRQGGISSNRDDNIAKVLMEDLALAREKEILPYVDSTKDNIY